MSPRYWRPASAPRELIVKEEDEKKSPTRIFMWLAVEEADICHPELLASVHIGSSLLDRLSTLLFTVQPHVLHSSLIRF